MEEKKLWSECLLCKGEYSDDIRMNKCLHSYCRECIEKDKYALSLLCPICHEPFLSQASSLPKNYSLLYWRSLSPPKYLNINKNSTNEINNNNGIENLNNANDINNYYHTNEINNNINKNNDNDNEININNTTNENNYDNDDNYNDNNNDENNNDNNNDNKFEIDKNSIMIDVLKLNENNSNKRIKIKEESELNDSPTTTTTTTTITNENKICEECEENKSEFYCKECKSFLCYLCSKQIHTPKIMKNHSIIDSQSYYSSLNNNNINNINNNNDNNNNNINNNSSESIDEIIYYTCHIHDKKKKELYCERCAECVCVLCIDKHRNHLVVSIIEKLENLKSNWIEKILLLSNERYKSFSHRRKILKRNFGEINEEIFQLKEKLEKLEEKRNTIKRIVNEIEDTRENIVRTSLFLNNFINSLPPLPLSSFLSSDGISDYYYEEKNDNNINIKNNRKLIGNKNNQTNLNIINIDNDNDDDDNNNDNNDNTDNTDNTDDDSDNENDDNKLIMKKRITIKHLFEMEHLENIFLLLPTPSNNYFDDIEEDANKYLLTNQLFENLNLISNFGSNGKKDNQFDCPNYLSFNDRLNLLGVSDFNNKRIQIFNRKGTLLRTFPFTTPRGIMIIPSLHLLAIVSQHTNEIQIFDISQTEKLNKKKIIKDPFPLCYSIGKKDKLNLPTGLGYSDHKKLLAVGNYGKKSIKIFSIKKEGYNIHSIINLSSKPVNIALSTPGDHLVVSSSDNSIKLFKWSAENDGEKNLLKSENDKVEEEMKWKEEGAIILPSCIKSFKSAKGVAFHTSVLRSYFIICDCSNFSFFDLITRKLIFQYRPTVNLIRPFFRTVWGISVDENANLIAVSDIHSHSVSIFRSL